MNFQFLARGLILGFSIAAPVGPIGVLCIRRTLARGRLSGFISGIGAASADALYGSIAAFGLTMVTDLLVSYRDLLGTIGGLFLCYLGVRTFFEKPVSLVGGESGPEILPSKGDSGLSYLRDYSSTLFLTLTNPMTILAFAAIFAGLGLSSAESSTMSALALVCGVFLGSAAWWLLLSSISHVLRSRFLTASGLRWVNRISGLIITGFGLLALWW